MITTGALRKAQARILSSLLDELPFRFPARRHAVLPLLPSSYMYPNLTIHASAATRRAQQPRKEYSEMDESLTRTSSGIVPSDPRSIADNGSGNTKSELIYLLHYHLDLFDHYQSTLGRPYKTLKRFFKIYIRDFDGAKELRDKLMHTKTTDEVRQILEDI